MLCRRPNARVSVRGWAGAGAWVGHLCLLDESVSGCHLTVVYVRDRGMCIYYSPFLLVFVGYVILID